ncbi:phenylalanine--tRNA ligase subunit beta [candidate division KSB1 bacterium]|nr:phenylalanine--tRNA ligase subunit beta [candidate division KSB1 bacterium]
MILSYRWLSELLDIPVSPDDLIEVLTYLGLEVEAVHRYAPALGNVVVGEVLECARIAGTEHLSLTQVNVGGSVSQIVCGAPNVAIGQKVVVMLPGAVTAHGMKIKAARLRGNESLGMIASERELGLFDSHEGILVGDADWKVGAPAAQYLELADTCYDVEITPNRPDFFSHVGVARDLAAKFRVEWRWPDYPMQESGDSVSSRIQVRIESPLGCPRYAARVIEGVKIAPSPYALRLRLARCGIRPISNIVDATNYLMLEFGHPLHAFDARFLGGKQIVVRYAKDKEQFTTLDGKDHALGFQDVLIADATRGVALAGVMGGLNSEIREDTTDVVIECAYFDSVHVRRTARAQGMNTDSSKRFERGMDPNGVPRVIDATACLMQRLGGGSIRTGRVDAYPTPVALSRIRFRPSRFTTIVGVDLPHDEMTDVLSRLGCDVKNQGDVWEVAAPSHRPDLNSEIDLIEEIIRVHGYAAIPTATSSRVPISGHDDPMFLLRRRVSEVMVSLGFMETLSVSMRTPEPRRDPPIGETGVELVNPVNDDMKRMHGSLLPALVQSAAGNWKRGDRNLRLFEIARVFRQGEPDDPRTWERWVLTGVLTGSIDPESWSRPAKAMDFFDLKAAILLLCRRLRLDNVQIFCYDIDNREHLSGAVRHLDRIVARWGIWSGEEMSRCDIDAEVAWFEFDLAAVLSIELPPLKYQPLSGFPLAWRDLAITVEESVTAAQLLEVSRTAAGEFLVHAEPFDVFRSERLGAGRKSVALRFQFSHPERSLKAEEVDEWMKRVLSALQTEVSAELR